MSPGKKPCKHLKASFFPVFLGSKRLGQPIVGVDVGVHLENIGTFGWFQSTPTERFKMELSPKIGRPAVFSGAFWGGLLALGRVAIDGFKV